MIIYYFIYTEKAYFKKDVSLDEFKVKSKLNKLQSSNKRFNSNAL